MAPSMPELSSEQWEFLSTLEALGSTIPIDAAGALCPLLPGALLDLLERGPQLGLIERPDKNQISLCADLPHGVSAKLQHMNTPRRLRRLLARLRESNLTEQIHSLPLANLLDRVGESVESARLKLQMASHLHKNRQISDAFEFLSQALEQLTPHVPGSDIDETFVAASLKFSNLAFESGINPGSCRLHLETALSASNRLGDKRSGAVIKLHLGRSFFMSCMRHEALRVMSPAHKEVLSLGDDDIIDRSSEFLALYYYMQGRFAEAFEYFERAVHLYEIHIGDKLVNPSAPVFMGLCATHLGQFHRAVGFLDCSWRRAKYESHDKYATTIRAVLGTVLLLSREKREALFHIRGARQEALSNNNLFARYFAEVALAYYHFLDGFEEKAHSMFCDLMKDSKKNGPAPAFLSPYIFLILCEFYHSGMRAVPGINFDKQLEETIRSDPNLHYRGIALRLKARDLFRKKKKTAQVEECLSKSEELLKTSGDPMQLARTRIDIALLKLKQGDREAATGLAQEARKGLSGHWEQHFPDGLRSLLKNEEPPLKEESLMSELMGFFLEMIERIMAQPDLSSAPGFLVSAMNRFLGAERGGLFWAEDAKHQGLVLRAASNISESEVLSDGFRSSMALIQKSYRERTPLILLAEGNDQKIVGHSALAIICLPLEVKNFGRCVLYHDNSYLSDCFDSLDTTLLSSLSQHLSDIIDRILQYRLINESRKDSEVFTAVQTPQPGRSQLITNAASMFRLLEDTDKIAAADTTVLIQGETGVGKELLANRLHQMSRRSSGPFVVIDPTTLPVSLVESELFGFEKGAFTGAERQKKGRVELADKGTLFIDEIGEMPEDTQGKMLRVLQEKAFVRIGGKRLIESDFRLVAATNRDLAEEVSRGHFRKDLYYRLNTVILTIPPLRERVEDIPLLAQHFLNHYAKKYDKGGLEISAEDEELLASYEWPGNIREFQNVIERAVILASNNMLRFDLPSKPQPPFYQEDDENLNLDDVQRRHICWVLKKTHGKIGGPGGAAELLGVKRTTLFSRLKKLGIAQSQYRA